MHLRQTSDASAAVVASAVSTSSFSSCFSLRIFFALLLKFLPAFSHRHSHILPSTLSAPLFFLISLLHSPASLSLSHCLPTCLLPIFIIAAIIWQMLLSPALVSVVLPPLSPCSLFPLASLYSLYLSLLSSPCCLLPQLASAAPASGYCLLLGTVYVVSLPSPLLLSSLLSSSAASHSSFSPSLSPSLLLQFI